MAAATKVATASGTSAAPSLTPIWSRPWSCSQKPLLQHDRARHHHDHQQGQTASWPDLLINASKLFSKGRPKNFLAEDHIARVAEVYHAWEAREGLAALITKDEAARNDYNLSPSR